MAIYIQGGGASFNQGGGSNFDDDLKRRMALAKQQGWSDDEINRSAMVERASHNFQQQQKQASMAQDVANNPTPQQQKPQPSGWKRFLVNAGALGASTLAGIAGVAAAPVTGGLSVAGAFGAGAGIEALRRKMLGEDGSVTGDLVNGALTALPGIGQAAKAVRGGKLVADTAEAVNDTRKATQATRATQTAADATQRQAQIVPDIVSSGGNRGANFTVDDAFNPGTTQPGKKVDIKQFFQPSDQGKFGAPGRLAQKTGADIRTSARGIQPGMRPNGESSRLTFGDAAERNQYLNNNTKGTAMNQLEQVSAQKQKAAEEINSLVDNNLKEVTPEDIAGAQDRIKANLLGSNGKGAGKFNPNVDSHIEQANNYARQMGDITDSKGWLNFKRTLDDDINYARSATSPDPVGEQVATAFRKEANSQLKSLHPEITDANKAYSDAQKAENALLTSKKLDPSGVAFAGTTFNGRGVGGGLAQRLQDFAGRTLQRTGGAASTPAAQMFAKQFAGRELTGQPGVSNTQPQSAADTQDQGAGAQLQIADNGDIQLVSKDGNVMGQYGNTGNLSGLDDPNNDDAKVINYLMANGYTDGDSLREGLAQWDQAKGQGMTVEQAFQQPGQDGSGASDGSGNPLGYSSADLFSAAVKAYQDGNSKASDQYLQMAEFAQKYEQQGFDNKQTLANAQGGDGLNVTKVTSQQYGLANDGLSSIQDIENLIKSNPSAITKSSIPGQGLPIVGGFISHAAGTTDYQSLAYNIADKYLKLTTGATANDSEIKNTANKLMPRAGDSPQEAQDKIDRMKRYFAQINQLASTPTTNDFSSLASAFGGGQQQSAFAN